MAALRRAIIGQNKVVLHYRYRGSGKRGYQRTVHPYGFLYGSRHYLVAWSEPAPARDFRSFALANIERVESSDEPFDRDPAFSLAAYAERSFGVFQEEPFDVAWKFSPKAAPDAREFLFHPTQTMEDLPDGSLVVRRFQPPAAPSKWPGTFSPGAARWPQSSRTAYASFCNLLRDLRCPANSKILIRSLTAAYSGSRTTREDMPGESRN